MLSPHIPFRRPPNLSLIISFGVSPLRQIDIMKESNSRNRDVIFAIYDELFSSGGTHLQVDILRLWKPFE